MYSYMFSYHPRLVHDMRPLLKNVKIGPAGQRMNVLPLSSSCSFWKISSTYVILNKLRGNEVKGRFQTFLEFLWRWAKWLNSFCSVTVWMSVHTGYLFLFSIFRYLPASHLLHVEIRLTMDHRRSLPHRLSYWLDLHINQEYGPMHLKLGLTNLYSFMELLHFCTF